VTICKINTDFNSEWRVWAFTYANSWRSRYTWHWQPLHRGRHANIFFWGGGQIYSPRNRLHHFRHKTI